VAGSVELDELDDISAHWPVTMPLNRKNLHIIVELPFGKRCVHWVSEISLTVSRLSSTPFLLLYHISPRCLASAKKRRLEAKDGSVKRQKFASGEDDISSFPYMLVMTKLSSK
jgi:hypothetical protein